MKERGRSKVVDDKERRGEKLKKKLKSEYSVSRYMVGQGKVRGRFWQVEGKMAPKVDHESEKGRSLERLTL